MKQSLIKQNNSLVHEGRNVKETGTGEVLGHH